MRAATATLRDLRSARDRARAEYLAATRRRSYSRDTARGRLWREFLQANAAYLRAKGQTR
jgi:hypothetical protein